MKETTTPTDEFSVKEFNGLIKEFGRFIKSLLHLYFRGLKKNKWIIIFLLAITSLCSGYFMIHTNKRYEGTASFTYNNLTKKFYGEQLNDINELLQSGDWDKVHLLLQLPVSQINNIESIKPANIYGSPLADDMSESKDKIFYVTATSSNTNSFDSLAIALENYLNNNAAVKEITRQKTDVDVQAISYKTAELKSIDSITKAYTKGLEKQSTSIVQGNAAALDPGKLLAKGDTITQEIVLMQEFLSDKRCVKIQQSFYASIHLKEIGKRKILLLSLAAFFILSLVVLFISNTFFSNQYVSE